MGIKERILEKNEEFFKEKLKDMSLRDFGNYVLSGEGKEIQENLIDLTLQEVKETIGSMRTDNPYPTDIFTGKTEEGKIGQFGRKVWNNCLDELEKRLKE